MDLEGPPPPQAGVAPLPAPASAANGAAMRDIVVIGASAGGLPALQQLVSRLPADFGAALSVVLHIGADAHSELAAILSRSGLLRTVTAEDGMPIEAGRIHVAPPACHLLVEPAVCGSFTARAKTATGRRATRCSARQRGPTATRRDRGAERFSGRRHRRALGRQELRRRHRRKAAALRRLAERWPDRMAVLKDEYEQRARRLESSADRLRGILSHPSAQ